MRQSGTWCPSAFQQMKIRRIDLSCLDGGCLYRSSPISGTGTLRRRRTRTTSATTGGTSSCMRVSSQPTTTASTRAVSPVKVGVRRKTVVVSTAIRSFFQVITDPGHEEHESTLQWVGGTFDPGRLRSGGGEVRRSEEALEDGVRAPAMRDRENANVLSHWRLQR